MTRTAHTPLPPVGTHVDVTFATPQGRMGCSGTVTVDTHHPGHLVILKRTHAGAVPVAIKPEMLLEVNGRRFHHAPDTRRGVTMRWPSGRMAAWNFDTPAEAFEWAAQLSEANRKNNHPAEVRVHEGPVDADRINATL